jgi:hypothetical protein
MKLFAKNSYKTRGGHRAEITDKSENRTPYPFKGIVYKCDGSESHNQVWTSRGRHLGNKMTAVGADRDPFD